MKKIVAIVLFLVPFCQLLANELASKKGAIRKPEKKEPIIYPANLETEYQAAPLSIDTPNPRFSWVVMSKERNARQSAYQILVAEENNKNFKGPLLWNSGKIVSSESSNIPYSGLPLKSKTNYIWQVRIWDKNGNQSSSTGSFRTGILDQKDLKGKWIWEDDKVEPNDYAYFRTEFELAEKPLSAYALVSAHNHYIFYINGKQLSGYVSPAPSDPYKSKLYVVYDICSSLKPGKNAISAIVSYRGASGQNYVNGVPGFLFEAEIKFSSGNEIMVITGEHWKVLEDTPYDESAPFLNSRKHTPSEYFDAKKEPNLWKEPGFDDSSWKNAVVVNTGFKLKAQQIAESEVEEILSPVSVKKPFFGVYIFDLGKEISGWARIKASLPEGTKLKLRYSDRLFLGLASRTAANEPTLTYYDQYTFSGKGNESFEPLFGYRGFRYIELTGFKGKPSADTIKGVFVHTALKPTAYFESSNELLNQIYKISVHTQKMGMLGQLVDCVHREQSQWHADADMQSGNIFYTFYDPHIVRKTLLDLKDGQFEDGRLPAFYPSSPRDFNYIPEWDLHYFPMLWRTYYYYNDRYILAECFSVVKKLIEFFEKWRDETGLLKKSDAWHISDWPEDYAKMDQSGDYLTVENCLYYDALVKSSEMAKILGYNELANKYRDYANQVKDGINKYLFDSSLNAYKDSSGSTQRHAGASVMALYFNIVPEELKQKVLEYVKSKGFGTSVCLTYYLIEMLYENDEGEFAYRLINKDSYPGWGYMIKKGDYTTWESWHNWASKSHPFNAYLSRYFISEIVGLKPGAPGWKSIIIKPHIDGDLKWAKATMKILPGELKGSWEKTKEGLKLSVTIPGNTDAIVYIPVQGEKIKIYEGKNLIWDGSAFNSNDEAIEFISKEKNYIELKIGSGEWDFEARFLD